jgi:hypothetical protein
LVSLPSRSKPTPHPDRGKQAIGMAAALQQLLMGNGSQSGRHCG